MDAYIQDGNSPYYFANIIGLKFAGVYLPRSLETNSWLAFGILDFMTTG